MGESRATFTKSHNRSLTGIMVLLVPGALGFMRLGEGDRSYSSRSAQSPGSTQTLHEWKNYSLHSAQSPVTSSGGIRNCDKRS